MLTCELRTTDLKEIIELMNGDENSKKHLIWKLKDDYNMLLEEYRKQMHIKKYECNTPEKYYGFKKLNYKYEIGADEELVGKVKFTNDLTENIKISLAVVDELRNNMKWCLAFQMTEIIRLKALEVVESLSMLKVKMDYNNDFDESNI